MKTLILKQCALLFLFACCFSSFTSKKGTASHEPTTIKSNKFSKAGIASPYPVKNVMPCPINITYRIYVQTPNGCVICGMPVAAIIAPGAVLNIPIPVACQPACDIIITLNSIGGGTPVGPVDVSLGHPNSNGTCPTCTAPCPGTYKMMWAPGGTIITP